MHKIRKGDVVVVITGKDKQKRGEVLQVLPKQDRVVVKNVNMVKKHTKPNPQKNQQGGIVEQERSIHVSNVAIFNEAAAKKDKVGFRILEDGRKERYFKSTGETIDV